MPKFLENALRHSGSKSGLKGKDLDHYVYGSLNRMNAMHGNKETAHGADMEEKHDADKKSALVLKDPPAYCPINKLFYHPWDWVRFCGHIYHSPVQISPGAGDAEDIQDRDTAGSSAGLLF